MSAESLKLRAGYVYDEKYGWYDSGRLNIENVQPVEHWENAETKTRIHSLLQVSGLYDSSDLTKITARDATEEELLRFHTPEHVAKVKHLSSTAGGGSVGDEAYVCRGSYEIACRSAGGVLRAIEEVMFDKIDACYCLTRPPGHHAIAGEGMGFCLFNNIVLGCLHARFLAQKESGKKLRVAIVDYDVHHGNGTEAAFFDDQDVLFISLHQDNNYPIGTGGINTHGVETNINIPLPPGSGSGAYRHAFHRIVLPAIERFEPDLILVSSGFDASFMDPLSSMMVTSDDFRFFADELIKLAVKYSNKKIIFVHEGGYSKQYTPFCAVAVIESIMGKSKQNDKLVVDPFLEEAMAWGYQDLQPFQARLIALVAENHNLVPVTSDNALSPEEEKVQQSITELLSTLSISKRQLIIKNLESTLTEIKRPRYDSRSHSTND